MAGPEAEVSGSADGRLLFAQGSPEGGALAVPQRSLVGIPAVWAKLMICRGFESHHV